MTIFLKLKWEQNILTPGSQVYILLCTGCSVKVKKSIFLGFRTFLRKKGSHIKSLCCPSVCLSVKTLYLRNAWRYQVEIQAIYSNPRPHDFLIKNIFLYLLSNNESSCGAAARGVTVKPTGCEFDPHSKR